MKTVLILGAKSDIAMATAEVYAEKGWNLCLAGRKVEDELSSFKNSLINKYQCEISLNNLDILEFESHQRFFNSFTQKPNGLISFIGLLGNQKQSEMNFKVSKNIIDSNFTGIVSLINIFSTYYEEKEEGFIIGLSSVAGDRGRMSNYTYGASKAAFTAYLSGLRNRLSSKNIHVMTVKPGFVDTQMTQGMNLPPLLTVSPKFVAKKIYKMHQKRADQIYVPRIWFYIMFIIRLIPERLFKKLNT